MLIRALALVALAAITVAIIVTIVVVALLLIGSNALVIPPMLFAVAGAIVILFYTIVIIRFPLKLPQPKLDPTVIIMFTVIIGAAVIFTYISVIVESVPINYRVDKFDIQNMSMLIDREPTILIPLKNAAPFPPRFTDIQASIYHNVNTTIKAVKLSTNDSILSYPSNFTFVSSGLTENVQRDNYQMNANAIHPLTANNATGYYTIDILFFNKTDGVPQKWSVPFSWTTKTMDMSIFSYFWIVLVGVIVSRVLSLVLDKFEKIQKAQDKVKERDEAIILNNNDYVWITFSFIIAILIFTSFTTQVQVHLTPSIIANISLAFAFGFGFDKVLEVAKRFQTIAP
jgi:hypothetical protein